MKNLLLPLLTLVAFVQSTNAQDFYDRGTVQMIEIFFGFSDWDAQLDALASTTEDYLLADSVRINGTAFDSVGVKYKGNSSYNVNNQKNPIHIELDYVHTNADYNGYTDIKLQNGYQDPSMIREVLSYAILEQYMDCPKANFANVYINGTLRGLYSNAESINKDFMGNHYYTNEGSFVKCNPVGGAGPGGGGNPDLNYLGMDSSLYSTRYELKSTYGWNDLVDMIYTLNNDFTNIESKLDVDRALWMLAFNNVLVNLDSYSGAFRQNYYLYKDLNDRFVPTVWDLNMSFGGFPGGTGSGTLTNPSQLDPMSNSASANHPLIVKILGNAQYKRMYMAHVRTIVQEAFTSGDYIDTANAIRATIDASVQADPYKFFTYTQFQNSLTSNVTMPGPGGGQTQYGIQNLMNGRVSFFNTNSNYNLVAPTITAIIPSNTSPNYGDVITINATCSGENAVYLGYRMDHPLRFTRLQMFDDGAHNDGVAGDHVYGASVTLNCLNLEYYIYAENNNAGLFSPQRAEHEFHTLAVIPTLPAVGSLLINELLSDNGVTIADSNGQFEDFFELYNTTNSPINLTGIYVTDDATNLTKWMLPVNTILPANGYLAVWADNDLDQLGIHAGFKLSANGETLILTDGVTIYDQVTYTTQPTDVAWARCPDGQTFTFATPTYNANNNCYLTIEESDLPVLVKLYPVPSNGDVTILSMENETVSVHIADMSGRSIWQSEVMQSEQIPAATWNTGIYLVRVQNAAGKTSALRLIKE